MDDSSIFKLMLAKAVESEPLAFTNFDRTRNVQDQLQEMAWHPEGSYITYQKPLSLLGWLFEFAYHTYRLQRSEIQALLNNANASMEQLWLHFVMKTLYSKKWDGEQWE